MIANATAQAARLGCESHALSILGDDAAGRAVRSGLRAAGVRTRRLLLSPALPTTVAVCFVERRSGERRFLVPDRLALERRAPRLDLSIVDRRSVLLVDGHFPAQALAAARRARAAGGVVVADLNRPTPAALRLLRLCQYPIVAEEFARTYGEGDLRRALRRMAAAAPGSRPVVTLGPRGALVLEAGRIRPLSARRARIVDTTGAGDAFHGAFCAGLVLGHGYAGALDLAARAGAVACGALGGQTRQLLAREL
jgi:sulfofructose kinase